jgi:hypothetical protein
MGINMNQFPKWLFRNSESSEAMPPFGVGVITDSEIFEERMSVDIVGKPGTTFYDTFAVNSGRTVNAGKRGNAQLGQLVFVSFDTGTPAFGEVWGPKPGQWTISKGYPGFKVRKIISNTSTK